FLPPTITPAGPALTSRCRRGGFLVRHTHRASPPDRPVRRLPDGARSAAHSSRWPVDSTLAMRPLGPHARIDTAWPRGAPHSGSEDSCHLADATTCFGRIRAGLPPRVPPLHATRPSSRRWDRARAAAGDPADRRQVPGAPTA